MTHILLMRHAKSSWDNEDLSDHQRPLNARGRLASEKIALTLHAKGFSPDEIWASDSQRTTETAKIIMRTLPGSQTVKFSDQLYHASAEKIEAEANKYQRPEGSLMILAHNPGMEALFEQLTGTYIRFPTAACAIFKINETQTKWFHREGLTYVDFIKPKDLDI